MKLTVMIIAACLVASAFVTEPATTDLGQEHVSETLASTSP